MSHCLVTAWQSKSGSIFIGGADVTVKKIPTTIQIILLKKIQFYSESNLFKWFENKFADSIKMNYLF